MRERKGERGLTQQEIDEFGALYAEAQRQRARGIDVRLDRGRGPRRRPTESGFFRAVKKG